VEPVYLQRRYQFNFSHSNKPVIKLLFDVISDYSLKYSVVFRNLEQQPVLSFAADIYDSWIIHVSDVYIMIQPRSTFFTLTFQSPYAGFPSFELWNKFFDYEKNKIKDKTRRNHQMDVTGITCRCNQISLISKSHASN